MLETHPFKIYIPKDPKYLLLGSFTAIEANKLSNRYKSSYNWFYNNGRNQFWSILTAVYSQPLTTINSQQQLFTQLHLAIGDLILSCERKKNCSLDTCLVNITFDSDTITKLINNNPIKTIYFSSRFVEKLFRKHFEILIANFPNVRLITLPSPSPRYAQLTKQQKVEIYRKLLPRLKR